MVRRRPAGQRFAICQPDAEEVYLACDCVGWFPMHKVDDGRWQVTLELPHGRYRLRYCVRTGHTIRLCGEENLEIAVPAEPASAAPRIPSDSGASTRAPVQRLWHVQGRPTADPVDSS